MNVHTTNPARAAALARPSRTSLLRRRAAGRVSAKAKHATAQNIGSVSVVHAVAFEAMHQGHLGPLSLRWTLQFTQPPAQSCARADAVRVVASQEGTSSGSTACAGAPGTNPSAAACKDHIANLIVQQAIEPVHNDKREQNSHRRPPGELGRMMIDRVHAGRRCAARWQRRCAWLADVPR